MEALVKGRLAVVLTCRKQWLHPMPKASLTHSKVKSLLLERDIKHTIESTAVAQPKHKAGQLPTSKPYQTRLLKKCEGPCRS
jgi:hypothetical protein